MENDFEIDVLQTAQNELAVTQQAVRNPVKSRIWDHQRTFGSDTVNFNAGGNVGDERKNEGSSGCRHLGKMKSASSCLELESDVQWSPVNDEVKMCC